MKKASLIIAEQVTTGKWTSIDIPEALNRPYASSKNKSYKNVQSLLQ